MYLWIGVGLVVWLIPISIPGGVLVSHDGVGTLINPQHLRYTLH